MIESRTEPTPVVLAYMDSMIGMFRAGGFSIDLTHHVMHAMGSRLLGFTQELFDDTADGRPGDAGRRRSGRWPAATPTSPSWSRRSPTTQASVVGQGCDDQFEFEFALDLLLDGLERLRDQAEATAEG